MGNSASDPVGEDLENELDQFDGVETLGYRVLGVQPNSPAAKAGLVSFFDFILGANGAMLLGSGEGLEEGDEYDDVDFPKLLTENKGKSIELLVWNIKAQEKRLVELIPTDGWGGAGLLGVTIKLDDYGGADERLIRVLDVEHNSPASIAGLVPLQDYLLGTTVMAFADTKALASTLQYHVDQVVELYVYNVESDVVRVVALMPTLSWGGHGLLGAEVGTGYLHGLPQSCRSTIGQSVERKVRVRVEKDDDKNDIGRPEPLQPLVGADATKSQTTLVEMEPHLEMERSESEEHKPENTTRQPYELGAPAGQPSMAPKKKPVRNEHQTTTQDVFNSPQQDASAAGQQASYAPPRPSPTQRQTSDDAVSLFSGPPPEQTSEPLPTKTYGHTGIAVLPPPPKMST